MRSAEIVCVGVPQINLEAVNEWLDSRNYDTFEPQLDNIQAVYETAGRTCYMSFPPKKGRTSEKYVQNLWESRHASVFTHGMWSFIISGVSRAFSHEWVRHHIGTGISQLSQRYVDANETDFVCPPEYVGTELEKEYETLAYQTRVWYNELITKGEKILPRRDGESKRDFRKRVRQSARYILPNGTETIIFWSANTTELRHIFLSRCSSHADTEMRDVANLLYDVVAEISPLAVYGLVKEFLPDGSFSIKEDFDAADSLE